MIAQLNPTYIKTRPNKAISRLLSYVLFEGRPLTTKGQWINPIVLSLFELEKRLPQLKTVEKPIFIVGTGRSGSTILGVVLSMHEDVGFLNEPKALWHSIYPEEDLVGTYSRGAAKYRLEAEDVTEKIARSARKLYGAYLTAVASSRVVDKYPEAIFRIPFILKIFPDAKFIFLVRNGWDTCHSIDRWSKRLGVEVKAETHDWWGVNNRKWNLLVDLLVATDPKLKEILPEIKNCDRHSDMAALEWIVTMQEGLRLLKEYPESIYMLRYEDLVTTPESTLTKLLEFAELPRDRKFFDYATQILSPPAEKKPFLLNSAIRPFFDETMALLGY